MARVSWPASVRLRSTDLDELISHDSCGQATHAEPLCLSLSLSVPGSDRHVATPAFEPQSLRSRWSGDRHQIPASHPHPRHEPRRLRSSTQKLVRSFQSSPKRSDAAHRGTSPTGGSAAQHRPHPGVPPSVRPTGDDVVRIVPPLAPAVASSW